MSNRPEWSSRAQGKVASTVLLQFSRKEMITWHEMRQFQQPHHYTVWQWRFYPIVQTCKKWVMTLSSSMAMYSVMRDIPDARNVPMEKEWVALYLYATGKFSNQLTLEQWAFEYGLPFFLYALYIDLSGNVSKFYAVHLSKQRLLPTTRKPAANKLYANRTPNPEAHLCKTSQWMESPREKFFINL